MNGSRQLRTNREQRQSEQLAAKTVGLEFLTGTSKSEDRMRTLLGLLQSADSMSASLRSRNVTLPAKTHDERELLETLEKIDAILGQHRGARSLWVSDDYSIQELFGFDEKRYERSDAYAWEVRIIGFFLELLRNGSMQRLKTCRECQKWYYATADHQLQCSANCRQRFASHSDDFKEERRKYMRDYRSQQKAREKRQLMLARKKGH